MRFDGSRPLTPSQAFELGKSEGERTHRAITYGGVTVASLPDWKLRDQYHSPEWHGGIELGAHEAYRQGFNAGIGREIFKCAS